MSTTASGSVSSARSWARTRDRQRALRGSEILETFGQALEVAAVVPPTDGGAEQPGARELADDHAAFVQVPRRGRGVAVVPPRNQRRLIRLGDDVVAVLDEQPAATLG